VEKTSQISIHSPYITLGQFLKLSSIISSGGQAKSFLHDHSLIVNGVLENRRGRKLKVGDHLEYLGLHYEITPDDRP
jgi:ribosome-associated protein